MLSALVKRLRKPPLSFCFCTLAIHKPYRRRAQLLVADAPGLPWVVFTDEPSEFSGPELTAIRHEPTGPMAYDFLTTLPPMGKGKGRPAYHDKRFVIKAALEKFDTAIFIDADSRIQRRIPKLPHFQPGLALVKDLQTNIRDHVTRYGSFRLGALQKVAIELFGDAAALESAPWCSEALFAVTKDGNESQFFDAWDRGAQILQLQNLFTGEGGVIGLAAKYAGWAIDYKRINKLAASVLHEGNGPKSE